MRSDPSSASPTAGVGPRIVFVVGKQPRPGTVISQVVELLGEDGCRAEIRLPHDDPEALDLPDDVELVVHRGLSERALSDLRVACASGSAPPLTCCNPISAVQAVARRHALAEQLARAGLPVPRTTLCEAWGDVRSSAGDGRVVVKAEEDGVGRAANVAVIDRHSTEPFPGPWVVQEVIANDGTDRKLYVTGRHVSAQVKPSPLWSGDEQSGGAGVAPRSARFEPSNQQVEIALGAGEATGLHLYGVDLVEGPAGPVVVDVNVFPGYRGIPEAASQVADHVRGHLRDQE